jgi:hypothetical protein
MTKQDKSVERLRALGLDVTGKTPHQVTAELLKERALVDAKLGEWRNFESNLDRANRLTEEKRILEAALLACPRGPEGVMRESDQLEIHLRAQIPAFNAAMAGTQRELRWWLWPLASGGDTDWSSLGSLGRRLDDYLMDLASCNVAFPFQRAPAPVVGRIGPAP